jgi:hypothetical protein
MRNDRISRQGAKVAELTTAVDNLKAAWTEFFRSPMVPNQMEELERAAKVILLSGTIMDCLKTSYFHKVKRLLPLRLLNMH